ncbi:hypothetical protein SAMN05661012_03306 [Chitinophaga sancti]|uniref:Uncharacterized protein n=1 Tax=Chitinophaga sancti TaxID=1004 RepID=A0A1K1R2G1_9BACT|nr:hypothetical protein SAMN05661012_03306 [Chitinophaga sancti]
MDVHSEKIIREGNKKGCLRAKIFFLPIITAFSKQLTGLPGKTPSILGTNSAMAG